MIGIRKKIEEGKSDSIHVPASNELREFRLKKDISSFQDETTWSLSIPDPANIFVLHLSIYPQEGLWKGCLYTFEILVPEYFPEMPYKAKLLGKIYHPNIDFEGRICLNILRESWTPAIDLSQIACGLYYLFVDPNPNDPLNQVAGQEMMSNMRSFEKTVMKSIHDQYIELPDGTTMSFPSHLVRV